jgi:tetrahydromethanopterin S-methyltransferase subunit C
MCRCQIVSMSRVGAMLLLGFSAISAKNFLYRATVSSICTGGLVGRGHLIGSKLAAMKRCAGAVLQVVRA